MTGGRVTGLRAGNVEPNHAFVPEPDRQLRDLAGQRGVPHRGDQTAHDDGTPCCRGSLLPVGETRKHRVGDGIERQPPVDVQFGGEAHLGVNHRIGG